MTAVEQQQIQEYRQKGFGYKAIAEVVGVTRDSVRGYCKRNGLDGDGKEVQLKAGEKSKTKLVCPCCGQPITKNGKGRTRRFCSDNCRRKWWTDNYDARNKKEEAMYHYGCPHCGKQFSCYGNKTRKYCSHDCYIKARFWGEEVRVCQLN